MIPRGARCICAHVRAHGAKEMPELRIIQIMPALQNKFVNYWEGENLRSELALGYALVEMENSRRRVLPLVDGDDVYLQPAIVAPNGVLLYCDENEAQAL